MKKKKKITHFTRILEASEMLIKGFILLLRNYHKAGKKISGLRLTSDFFFTKKL